MECERFYKFQNQQPDSNQNSSVLQGIYQTLSNHSRVIRKLAHNVNVLRSQMGLPKTLGMEDVRIFKIPTMGHNYYEKKPLLKERPTITIQKSNVHRVKVEKDDRITLDDLTAGMSRVKLDKIKEAQAGGRSGFPNHKPMRISTKKLEALTKIVSKVEDIEIPLSDKNVYDPFDISVKNRARSRNLINKLDDKTIPVKSDATVPEDWEENDTKPPVLTPSSSPTPPGIMAPPRTTKLTSPPTIAPTKTLSSAPTMTPITTLGFKSAPMIAPTTILASSPIPPASTTKASPLATVTVIPSTKPEPVSTSVAAQPQITTASIHNLSKISLSSPAAPLAFGSVSPSPALFGSTSPKPGTI